MEVQPTTLDNLGPLRRSSGPIAERAGWATIAGSSSVLAGLLAGTAPMVLFGLVGIVGSAIAFVSWPTLSMLGVLLIRPAIDTAATQLVLGPANALGAIGIAVFVGGGAYLVLRGPRIRVPLVTVPFVAFLAVGLATVRYAPSPTEALGFWLQLCSLFVMFCLGVRLFRTPSALKKLLAVVLASAVVPTLVALFQLATGTNLVTEGKGSSAAVAGTISHPNGLSFFLLIVLAVGLVVALEGAPRRLRAPLGIGLALGAGAFLGTYTRSAWVGLAVVLLVLATVHYRRLFAVGGVALVALAIAVPSSVTAVEGRFSDLSPSSTSYSTNSFQWRLENWSRMTPYATDRPLTGHGLASYLPLTDQEFGRFDYDFIVRGSVPGEEVVYAHNDYLYLAVEMGIPGAVLWLSIFLGLILVMARARACPTVRPLATALLAVVAALMVASGCDNVVLYTVVLLPLMALCGAVAGLHQEWRRNELGGST
jgi:O-antigen ligase